MIGLRVFGVLLLGSTAILAASSVPSQAKRAYCIYAASDNRGHRFDEGASASKMSSACDRARRQCNRILKWKQKHGKFGRTNGCQKLQIISR
jgi:hypothetical protein